MIVLPDAENCMDKTPECDGRTNGQTERQTDGRNRSS